jgi:hypothetical protein
LVKNKVSVRERANADNKSRNWVCIEKLARGNIITVDNWVHKLKCMRLRRINANQNQSSALAR